ncbi:MAG: hypothetical protein WC822_03335 [Candidatus Paceibacterota bacterium]|jgi:hypothetical protein
MEKELQSQIFEVIEILKALKKKHLAKCIEENWQKTVLSYSFELNIYKPAKKLEKEMLEAFKHELKRIGHKKEEIFKISASLEKRRTIQTGPHLGATEGPRMLCINWLGSLGVKENDYYVVGMFSGIPFSNHFRPGRINKKTDSINLFPSNMQDALVYRSVIPQKLIETIENLPEKIKELMPTAIVGESYTQWALNVCQNIERSVLEKQNLIYLDINEVVAEYLIQVLKNKNRIFYKIFFDTKIREEFIKAFPNEIIFYSPMIKGKYETIENFFFSENKLKSKEKEILLNNPKKLIQEIKENRLCPGLIIGFLALTFLNHFKCFGSFAQVEYLPTYQEKLSKLKFMKKFKIEKVPTANLTTGTFPENPNSSPVDVILGEKLIKNPNMLLGEILIPMKEVLIGSYFTGDVKKNLSR